MPLSNRPEFAGSAQWLATIGDFALWHDARLGVLVLGDTRTHHLTLFGDDEGDTARAMARQARDEGLALIADWTFALIRNRCVACGVPIDRRATRCQRCAVLYREDGETRSSRARVAAYAKHRQDRVNAELAKRGARA